MSWAVAQRCVGHTLTRANTALRGPLRRLGRAVRRIPAAYLGPALPKPRLGPCQAADASPAPSPLISRRPRRKKRADWAPCDSPPYVAAARRPAAICASAALSLEYCSDVQVI